MKYSLHDTFNDCVISRHRNGLNAMKAKVRHDHKIAALHGETAYIPKQIRKDNAPISAQEFLDLLDELNRIGFVSRPKPM